MKKALIVSVAIQLFQGIWERTKAALDYAFHFPNWVSRIERGHRQILDEIRAALRLLFTHNSHPFALRVGQYAPERAQEVAQRFESDRDWQSSLNDLEHWIENTKEK